MYRKNKTLNEMSLEEYKSFSELFEEDIYESIDIINCVNKRNVIGGPAPEQVKKEIKRVKKLIE